MERTNKETVRLKSHQKDGTIPERADNSRTRNRNEDAVELEELLIPNGLSISSGKLQLIAKPALSSCRGKKTPNTKVEYNTDMDKEGQTESHTAKKKRGRNNLEQ